jgi:hypothetical protein
MPEAFFIALRETLQCALLAVLVACHPPIRSCRPLLAAFLCGTGTAIVAGFAVGYIPSLSKNLWATETWTFWRFATESAVFYLSIPLLLLKPGPLLPAAISGVFALGFAMTIFEARAFGFLLWDMGAMRENVYGFLAAGAAGMASGLIPALALAIYARRLPLDRAFSMPSILMTAGAFKFATGGVGEIEKENIVVPLQRGLENFLSEGVRSVQSLLAAKDHPFLDVTLSGLAAYLGGSRAAMTLTLLFLMAPPLFILVNLFARPDPLVGHIPVAARRRSTVAFFRKDIMYRAAPVMAAFAVLVFMVHAVNFSLNPLYEPPPLPVREDAGKLRIPLSDNTGDFSDKKLRKYVYFHGNKQIIFIGISKPDGSVGLALDECEICRPAEWNVDARGYAQRGDHLVCKYCMTPIATSTVNNPGGCNPIPLPFRLEDGKILINVSDISTIFEKVQALDKQGTHL